MLPWYCNVNACLVLKSTANALLQEKNSSCLVAWHIWQRSWCHKHSDSLITDMAKGLSWFMLVPLIIGMCVCVSRFIIYQMISYLAGYTDKSPSACTDGKPRV